jgi:hypothetical protein
MKNLGKAGGGITPGELGRKVTGMLMAKLASAMSFDRLRKSADGPVGKAGSAVKDRLK